MLWVLRHYLLMFEQIVSTIVATPALKDRGLTARRADVLPGRHRTTETDTQSREQRSMSPYVRTISSPRQSFILMSHD